MENFSFSRLLRLVLADSCVIVHTEALGGKKDENVNILKNVD